MNFPNFLPFPPTNSSPFYPPFPPGSLFWRKGGPPPIQGYSTHMSYGLHPMPSCLLQDFPMLCYPLSCWYFLTLHLCWLFFAQNKNTGKSQLSKWNKEVFIIHPHVIASFVLLLLNFLKGTSILTALRLSPPTSSPKCVDHPDQPSFPSWNFALMVGVILLSPERHFHIDNPYFPS